MNQPTYDEPEAEAAARVAQFAAMSVNVMEALARLRAQRLVERADADERAAAAARAQRRADHAAASVAWAPAHDAEWLRRADVESLGRAWAAATTWAAADPDAADAAARVETALTGRRPEAMRLYMRARATGLSPAESMAQAAQHFAASAAIDAGTAGSRAEPVGKPRPPSVSPEPHVIAAHAYPFPAASVTASRSAGDVHVITTAPDLNRTTANTR